ncbi:hypothetical protein [Thermococcus sp.]
MVPRGKLKYVAFSYLATTLVIAVVSFTQDYLKYLHNPNHIPLSPLFHASALFPWILIPFFSYKLWTFGIVLWGSTSYFLIKFDSRIDRLPIIKTVIKLGAVITFVLWAFFAVQFFVFPFVFT